MLLSWLINNDLVFIIWLLLLLFLDLLIMMVDLKMKASLPKWSNSEIASFMGILNDKSYSKFL